MEEMKPAPAQVIELEEKTSMLLSSVMEETGALGVDIVIDNGGQSYTLSVSGFTGR